jgi:peptidyl-dipeptidase A
MLELGASKHWKQVLRQFTGESSLNAEAILDYFRPLEEWLKMENIKFEKTN